MKGAVYFLIGGVMFTGLLVTGIVAGAAGVYGLFRDEIKIGMNTKKAAFEAQNDIPGGAE